MLWHGGHVVVKGAIRFVTTAVLARLLLPKEFGVVGMALLVNEIVSLLGGFSLGVALIQKKDLDERYFDTTFWANLVVGMGLSLCFLVAAPIAAAFFKTPQVQPLVMFLALHYLIAAAGGVHKALLLRQLQFQRFAVLSVVSAVARSVVALALAFAGFGIWGIMMGLLAERITTLWMLLVMVPWRPRWHFAWRQFHDLFRFSRNLYGENLLRFFNANSDRFLTGRLLGASALGFYQFAYALPHLVVEYFTETVSEVLFPVYSKVQDDHARFRRGYTMTVTLTALVTFPLLVGTTYYATKSDFLAVRRLTRDSIELKELTPAGLDGRTRGWEAAAGIPTWYFLNFASRTQVGFSPFPGVSADTSTIRMDYFALPSDMDADGTQAFDNIAELVPYHQILAYYAASVLAAVDGDQPASQLYLALFETGLKSMTDKCQDRPNYNPSFVGRQ